jgi:hypothetical protein
LVITLNILLEKVQPILDEFEYRLVGNGAALLHGVKIPAGDIDILVKERPAVEALSEALSSFECLQEPTYLDQAKQYYAEYMVNEVDVGFSTVEWETGEDGLECVGPGPWRHFTSIPCGSYRIPTVDLELRLVSELLRERPER